MDIRVLKYFVTVVQEKNISKAAQKLFISQPALSKQLKDLEEELGTILFERGSRNIHLTEDGYLLLCQANEIIALVDKTISNISSNQNISGEISIGAAETKGIKQIIKIIKIFLEKFPNVNFNFFSGDANSVLEKLENGTLDFGIILGNVDKKNYNFLALPYKDTLGLLTTKDGVFSNHLSITSDDLAKVPLISSNQILDNSALEEWRGNNLDELNIIGSYNLLYNASLIVEEKIAHAICIDGIINTENTNLKFLPFNPLFEIELNIIWRKNNFFSKAIKEFIKTFSEIF